MATAADTPARTQAERTRTSERRLIRAALELIAESGLEGVTLRAIAERAGCSRGLVNYHFGSKEDLLRKATRELVRGWSRGIVAPAVGDRVGADALRTVLAEHLQLLRRSPEARAYYTLVYAALGPMPELQAELARAHATLRRRMADWIAAGIAAGAVRADVDPVQQAILVHGAVRGIVYQWMLDPGAIDLERAYDALATTIERALAPEG